MVNLQLVRIEVSICFTKDYVPKDEAVGLVTRDIYVFTP